MSKKVLFLTTTPTVGGNGDTLIEAAADAARAMTVVNRLCCTFACKTYQLGPRKKTGVLLTCTGSDVEEMKRHIRNITSLPSVRRAILDERIEVFTGCTSAASCKESPESLRRARETGRWAAE